MVEGEDVCRGGTVTIEVVLTDEKYTLININIYTLTHIHTFHFISITCHAHSALARLVRGV